MKLALKILLTPPLFIVNLIIVAAGLIYYRVLVRMYEFAWCGFDERPKGKQS